MKLLRWMQNRFDYRGHREVVVWDDDRPPTCNNDFFHVGIHWLKAGLPLTYTIARLSGYSLEQKYRASELLEDATNWNIHKTETKLFNQLKDNL